ncbi:hypothetical protein FOA52_009272 [Chlamydomonas sp. UWO 241]|nr:hypothetical protein FOA52_009272 [Chlamydomonas sp. UWO 241]
MRSMAMQLALVALLALAGVSARNLQQTDNGAFWRRFPPYNCDNRLEISPYYLEKLWTQPSANTTCFTMRTKTPTVVSECNAMDINKVELEVANTCSKGIRRFYVNGVEGKQPTPDTFVQGTRTLIKLVDIGLDQTNADGASICIETIAPCNGMENLCPLGDPTLCSWTVGVTPFSLDRPVVTNGSKGLIYTFSVLSNTPFDPNDPVCANSLLYKAEFMSKVECRRAVVNTYVNGEARPPQFDRTWNVQKVVKIGMAPGIPGTIVGTIGFELDSTSACPTLAEMCETIGGSCVYSLFDYTNTCCPLGWNIPAL